MTYTDVTHHISNNLSLLLYQANAAFINEGDEAVNSEIFDPENDIKKEYEKDLIYYDSINDEVLSKAILIKNDILQRNHNSNSLVTPTTVRSVVVTQNR